jgi:hypothetical protein
VLNHPVEKVAGPSGAGSAPESHQRQELQQRSRTGRRAHGNRTGASATAQALPGHGFISRGVWAGAAGLARLGRADGGSAYLRLSTRPVSQKLADVPADPAARERRRRQVVSGAYPLRRAREPMLTIAAMGAVVPEALAAAERLSELGAPADVVCVTSPGAGARRTVRGGRCRSASEPMWSGPRSAGR